ncbi:MAG: PQQ-dependent sugar dehydrogenase [Gemmataceae bacterium]
MRRVFLLLPVILLGLLGAASTSQQKTSKATLPQTIPTSVEGRWAPDKLVTNGKQEYTQPQLTRAKVRKRRPPLTTSKVIGSPEPPKPYRVTRSYPNLKMDWPICMERIPDTDYLLVINEARAYAPAKLHVVKDVPNVKDSNVLLAWKGVAYDVAFHPQFQKNGYLFVGWNDTRHKNGPHSQIVRYTMQPRHPFRLDPKSAKVIIEWPSNGHNGGAIDFGKDGFLYVTTGDGTVRRDIDQVGQRLDSLRSKVLRINVDKFARGKTYSVPNDNPFVKFPGARPEIWCYGLRNPWRITVDRKRGHVWVGNNGQDAWEQIYLVKKGANYGWSVYEGGHPFILERKPGPTPIQKPTFDHPHSEARSLTGGIVYYGKKYPELQGAYLYGDYSTGKIWAAKHDGTKVTWHQEIADTTLAITCFATNKDDDILIADHRTGGGFYRLEKRPRNGTSRAFPKRLGETGLFLSVDKHQLQPGVIPYQVNVPGWHDGAIIQRYLAIPVSQQKDSPPANVDARRGWNFPDGTVLLQTLSLPNGKRMETRLLTKQEGEWAGYSYLWNDEQTEAELVGRSGTRRKYSLKSDEGNAIRTWHVPSRSECMSCHSRAANYVLGLTTLQMNREMDYDGFRLNQLSELAANGILRSNGSRESKLLAKPPEKYPSLPNSFNESESLDRRARAYLHANCAHCHVPDGGGNARIVLDWNTPLDKTGLVNVRAMHGDFGIPKGKLVVPGEPDRSVLVYRLASLGSGRMPRVGSHKVDEKGLRLIREWIEEMALEKTNDRIRFAELKNLPAVERKERLQKLLGETPTALRLLSAIDGKHVESSLVSEIVQIATTKSSPTVRDLFERFLPEGQRIERLGVIVNPTKILSLKGDADTGRRLFFSKSLTCVNCHQINGQGKVLGPDLSKIASKHSREELLESMLYPSKRIDDQFATFAVKTKRGRLYTGLLLKQTKEQVVLKDNQHKILQFTTKDIDGMVRQTISLMPDALLKDLTPQEAADLLAFVSSLK